MDLPMPDRRRLVAALLALPRASQAQTPAASKPIQPIVPFPPGGNVDLSE